MKTKDITVKTILAIFVVVFGINAMVFVPLPDMVLGALIGFVSSVIMFFFGSSSGSANKDKMIQDAQAIANEQARADIGGGNTGTIKH